MIPSLSIRKVTLKKSSFGESWSGRSWDSNPGSAELPSSTEGNTGEWLQSDAKGNLAQNARVLSGTRERLALFLVKDQLVLVLAFHF